jgi:hypothetical protein
MKLSAAQFRALIELRDAMTRAELLGVLDEINKETTEHDSVVDFKHGVARLVRRETNRG